MTTEEGRKQRRRKREAFFSRIRSLFLVLLRATMVCLERCAIVTRGRKADGDQKERKASYILSLSLILIPALHSVTHSPIRSILPSSVCGESKTTVVEEVAEGGGRAFPRAPAGYLVAAYPPFVDVTTKRTVWAPDWIPRRCTAPNVAARMGGVVGGNS